MFASHDEPETVRGSAWTGRLAVLAALSGLAALALPRLPAADTWWTLASGRALVAGGRILSEDPFSFGGGRLTWLNHEWLGQILFYLVERALGLDGLFLVRTAVVVLAFAALPLWGARMRGVPTPQAALVVLGCGGAAEGWAFFDARAYLFTYLGLSVTLLVASETLRTGGPRWLPVLAPVILVWANCHGGFILGPMALLVAALGCRLDPRVARLAGAFAATALASLILCAFGTPLGFEALRFPFSLLTSSAFTVGLNEWARPDLVAQWPFSFLLLASAALGPRADPVRRAWLLVFLGAGLLAWRHAPLGALAAAHVLPDLVPGCRPARFFAPRLVLSVWGGAALLAGTAVAHRLQGGALEWTMTRTHFPVSATRFLLSNPRLPRELFNPYEWGGYLEWNAWPKHRVFIDGRAHTVYSEQRYAEAMSVQYGEAWSQALERGGLGRIVGTGRSWQHILDGYGVRMVLCNRLQGDLYARISVSPRWIPVHVDPVAAIFLRNDADGRALSATLVHPVSPGVCLERSLQALRSGREDLARDWARRAVAEDPRWAQPRVVLGTLLLRSGEPDRGEAELRRALRLDRRVPEAHFNLAMLALNRGDPQTARRELRAELRWNPDHPAAARLLADLEGEPAGASNGPRCPSTCSTPTP